MSAVTKAGALGVATTGPGTSLFRLSQVFEAWLDPPAYQNNGAVLLPSGGR
jgi:hypothetical protein